ncbi:MarR family transcriptional regulator [Arthrobacter sp. ISL-48]|uniref:MarR family winged helix-turn-helix transcriptional regulator n=1 Tax=Arthrobacter sp. ISL-48 TaxID=2819110 RepID=UPI001BEB4F2B|nr:MarR family transcriptional regulator [Arthrobacter sp. ISL-48]MBT2534107.1 MarR family transcriptional regulator [Arthrobacter sp. ISL-48]
MSNHPREHARRSPNRTELAVWREYIETAGALQRALASGLQSSSGVSPGDYGVLLALSEAADHRLRSSVLAEVIGWERSRLSHHLGRMEARGLIRRRRSDADNGGAAVELTDDGARKFRSASVSHLRLIRELFIDALTAAEIDNAGKIAASLRRQLGDGG